MEKPSPWGAAGSHSLRSRAPRAGSASSGIAVLLMKPEASRFAPEYVALGQPCWDSFIHCVQISAT